MSAPRYRRCKEKFHAALHHLAVGEGDVRDRLRGADRYLSMLSEEEVPPKLRPEWNDLLLVLNKRGPVHGPDGLVYQNALDHTLSRMRNSTGRKIAERIYTLISRFDWDAKNRKL
jgi:hypothetical protein